MARTRQYHLRPGDGKVSELCVQSFDAPANLTPDPPWTRIGRPSLRISSIVLYSHWVWASTLVPGSEARRYTPWPILLVVVKFILTLPIFFLSSAALDLVNFQEVPPGEELYDPVRTGDLSEPFGTSFEDLEEHPGLQRQPSLAPSQDIEDMDALLSVYEDNVRLSRPQEPTQPTTTSARSPTPRRDLQDSSMLGPRYLCFMDDSEVGYTTRLVSEYRQEHNDAADTEFIFVSYTRLQFNVATDEEIDKYEYPDEPTREAYRQTAKSDRRLLSEWGAQAARAAGKQAFWLDFECVRDDDGVSRSSSSSQDVYRICDIVRAAHSMIIAIGPSRQAKAEAVLSGVPIESGNAQQITPWLRQWGSRLWTLPELLLCPNEHRIKLYVAGSDEPPRALAKRNFAEHAWEDGESVKELLDHFEGSAILAPLHLLKAALQCFSRRKTDQFSPGDIAYAIMGLFPARQRPNVDQTDSGFQAFAKLTRVTDDGGFLERLLCILPPNRDAPWFDTRDAWGAALNDIRPAGHVVDIVGEDTVELDGISGAAIRWDGLDALISRPPSSDTGRFAFTTLIAVYGTAGMVPLIATMYWGCLQLIIKGSRRDFADNTFTYIFLSLMFAPLVLLGLPTTFLMIKARSSEWTLGPVRLVGIEGHVDTKTIERHLYGFAAGQLTERNDAKPTYYDDQTYQGPGQEPLEDEVSFTLVDTYLRTVTHSRARNLPVAAFVVGQEAGLQRTLLCSYSHERNAYVREQVLRLSARALEKMRRSPKIRLSLNFRAPSTASHESESATRVEEPGVNPSDGVARHHAKIVWPIAWAIMLLSIVPSTAGVNGPRSVNEVWNGMPGALLSQGVASPIYAGAFLAMQLPALFLLRRIQIMRLLPAAVLVKATLFAISPVVGMSPSHRAAAGLADGIFVPTVLVLIWSWYSPRELPFVLMCWCFGGRVFGGLILELLLQVRDSRQEYVFNLCQYGWFVLHAVLYGTLVRTILCDVNRPLGVRWLPIEDQQRIAEKAAWSSASYHPTSARRSSKPWASTRYAWQALLFAIVLLSSINSRAANIRQPLLVEGGFFLGAVVITAILYTRIGLVVPFLALCSAVSLLSIAVFGGSSPSRIYLHALEKPLIWTLTIMVLPDSSDALLCLATSGGALGLGLFLSSFIPSSVSLPLEIVQLVLIQLLWAPQYWATRVSGRPVRTAGQEVEVSTGFEEAYVD